MRERRSGRLFRRWCDRFGWFLPLDRLGPASQRLGDHLVHLRDRDEFQMLLHIVRDFRQILLILFRNENGGDPGTQCREQLLLQAADRQNAAAQRDLAGHRDIAAHRQNIRRLIAPEDNRRDLQKIPEAIRKEMEFVFVSNMDEVIAAAILLDPSQAGNLADAANPGDDPEVTGAKPVPPPNQSVPFGDAVVTDATG